MDWSLSKSPFQSQGPAFLSWPRPLRELLVRRGFVNDEALDEFLNPDLKSLKDPFSILNMSAACDRIAQAFLRQEKICIYADFDLDGTSGCALLKKGFEQLGFTSLIPFQPKRLKDGYGLHSHVVEELKKQNVDLIITCDVGITAHAAGDKAHELKMDLIITDHHLPSQTLPKAHSVVNPNQTGDSSGLGYLSGAGVGFYLLRALKRVFTDRKIGTPEQLHLQGLLDCFTIATLTDMVPLMEDNRVLVKMGLHELARTQRPGLSSLLSALKLGGRTLSSSDVAIRFAPKLNALSRLEGDLLPLDLFLMEDPVKAEMWVSQVLLQNQERVQLQSEALKEAQDQARSQGKASCVFVHSDNFHRGVIGLIATSLSQEKGKPSFVASLDPEEKKLVGSCRLPDSSDHSLVEALSSVQTFLLRFGGHAKAAGFEVSLENLESVKSGLEHYFQNQKASAMTLHYEAHLELSEFNQDLMESLEKLQPFGVGFETPLFLVERAQIVSVKKLKGGHLKLGLEQKGTETTALLFGPSSRQVEICQNSNWVDVVTELQSQVWNGKKSLQLFIEDIRLHGRAL